MRGVIRDGGEGRAKQQTERRVKTYVAMLIMTTRCPLLRERSRRHVPRSTSPASVSYSPGRPPACSSAVRLVPAPRTFPVAPAQSDRRKERECSLCQPGTRQSIPVAKKGRSQGFCPFEHKHRRSSGPGDPYCRPRSYLQWESRSEGNRSRNPHASVKRNASKSCDRNKELQAQLFQDF